jgi:hypothetical protein
MTRESNKNGKKKTFHWYSKDNGGKDDPGAWRVHTPEQCKFDKIQKERQETEKNKKECNGDKKGLKP